MCYICNNDLLIAEQIYNYIKLNTNNHQIISNNTQREHLTMLIILKLPSLYVKWNMLSFQRYNTTNILKNTVKYISYEIILHIFIGVIIVFIH